MMGFIKSQVKKLRYLRGVPPGHAAPSPSLEDRKSTEEEVLSSEPPSELPGIDLNEEGQLSLFGQLSPYAADLPFPASRSPHCRYFLANDSFCCCDAVVLYCMLRHLQPRRILSVGCGYSSAVILDTNELHFDNAIACTFLSPYPEHFLSLLKEGDRERVDLIAQPVQDVDLDVFRRLSAGDILFLDSARVSSAGSDVTHALFALLPALASGVHVHFHDVFAPFERPREWPHEGRAWDEDCVMRAFLQYNGAFRIEFFNAYWQHFHAARLAREMPLCLHGRGASLWLRKL